MLTKTCSISGKKFVITDDDLAFYKKVNVSSPEICPEERMRQRLSFRNERTLFRRNCSATKKAIISLYPPDTNFPVYDNEYWWSDHWDAKDYGIDFDFSTDFFPQFKTLWIRVPKMARIQQGNIENSQYTNAACNNKNCYLIFSADGNEDCLYAINIDKSRDCLDCYMVINSELVYESIDCLNTYNVQFSQQIGNSSDIYYSRNCNGCHHLFACCGLTSKEYHVLNKPVSKEYFENLLNSDEEKAFVLSKFNELYLKTPRKYAISVQCENCSGNVLGNCKNVRQSYMMVNCEDCKYCDGLRGAKDCMDVSYYGCTGANELGYNTEALGHGTFDVKCSKLIWGGSRDIEYCYECFHCQNCFGCTGLKNAEYCIFNKQYSSEEYEKIRQKIINHMKKTGEWGAFFPISMTPFCYNDTVAQDYLPLDQASAEKLGYRWREDKPGSKYLGKEYQIPTEINAISDDICDQILTCKKTGKNYKIQPTELKFYRMLKLPIPRLCPDARHEARMKLRNPRQLWARKCDNCSKEIQTTFSPDRPEIIYCEDCYAQVLN